MAEEGQSFVPTKTELVLQNPVVKKCLKNPAKWTEPFVAARPIYSGVVLLDTRHDGKGPNPAEVRALLLHMPQTHPDLACSLRVWTLCACFHGSIAGTGDHAPDDELPVDDR